MPDHKLLTDEEIQKINEDAHKEYLEQGVFILSCLMQKPKSDRSHVVL